MKETAIILFDGECRLCNSTVDFVVRRDPNRYFKFASLQSDAAQRLLQDRGIGYESTDPETIYLIEREECYTRSSAALRIAKRLKWPWPFLYIGIIVPRFIRDAIYNFVGSRRKKWFGVAYTCDTRISEEEKSRFLDR